MKELKRGLKITLAIIFFILVLALISGRTIEASGLLRIATILFLTLFIALYFKGRIKGKIEEKDYRGALIQSYLVFLLIFIIASVVDLILGTQISSIIKSMVFFVIMGAGLIMLPIMTRLFRVELHQMYNIGLKVLLKFILISIILAVFLGGSMVLLEWLGIISWR